MPYPTRIRPEWTHVRNDTLPTPGGGACQVELVECYRSPGRSGRFGPQVTSLNAREFGLRALVTDLDGHGLFKVEAWLPVDYSRAVVEDRVLAETERRLDAADWSRDVVYVLTGF